MSRLMSITPHDSCLDGPGVFIISSSLPRGSVQGVRRFHEVSHSEGLFALLMTDWLMYVQRMVSLKYGVKSPSSIVGSQSKDPQFDAHDMCCQGAAPPCFHVTPFA